MTDQSGTDHTMNGAPRAHKNWVPYGSCPTGHAMIDWTTSTGAVGLGTSMDAYPLDTVSGGFLHPDIRMSSPSRIEALGTHKQKTLDDLRNWHQTAAKWVACQYRWKTTSLTCHCGASPFLAISRYR